MWFQSARSCTLMRLGFHALRAAPGAEHDSSSPAHLQLLKSTGSHCHAYMAKPYILFVAPKWVSFEAALPGEV